MPYVFNRSLRFAPGRMLDSMAWATKVTEKVNAAGGPRFGLWTQVFGADVGTVGWTTVVDDMTELVAVEEKLMTDAGYVDLVEEGTTFGDGNGVHDRLVQLVHADPDGVEAAQYAAITTAVLAPGQSADGMAVGVEIAQRLKAITGLSASFGIGVTGVYGEVTWFVLAERLEQIQAGDEALAADPGWVDLIDTKTATSFIAGSGHHLMTRKLA